MLEIYCKANETPQKIKHDKLVEDIAQYLLDEVCSNYDYEWANAWECDKKAFRHYAKDILNIISSISKNEQKDKHNGK